MYKISFYVPESHLETLKSALFDLGAGRYKEYDQCCWQVLGGGQFRPLAKSQPYLGVSNRLENVAEYKVEMICGDAEIKEAVKALIRGHPYEEPAYEIYKIMTIEDL